MPAAQCRAEIAYADGHRDVIPSKGVYELNRGDRIHCWGAGGGGYGDPLERDPDLVLADVHDRKVSREGARSDYGVVVTGDPMTVDLAATRRLREEREGERGPVSWVFDRGELGRE